MAPNQKVLSWKDHNGTLVSFFENLLKQNFLVDCTLAAEGKYLKAHKMVLCACSPYFELLFSQENEKNPIVILKDVEFQELEAAVNFMYRGEVEVCEDRLAAFLEVAESLQIKGLECYGKSQRSKENTSLLEKIASPKTAVSPLQQSRSDEMNSCSDSAGQDPNLPGECELVGNNENSAVHQPLQSESCRSPPNLPVSSFPSQGEQDTENNEDSLKNSLSSLTGENGPSEMKPVIKFEPPNDICEEEKSEEADMDFRDDFAKMEEEENWNEHNAENTSDNHPISQQDLGINWSHQDSAQSFPSSSVKEEPNITSTQCHQETYSNIESAGTSAASTGSEPENATAVDPEGSYKQQPTEGATQFCNTVTTDRLTNFIDMPAEPLRSSKRLQKRPLLKNGKYILQCKKNSSSNLELQKHRRRSNSNRVRKCPYCDYTTDDQSALTPHLRTHTVERPYECAYCALKFSMKHHLKTHIKIHTGEKPYQCPECNFKSNDVSVLIVHRRRHSGEKPYQCSKCDYKSNSSGNLRVHQRIHTGEKPYQCPECDYKARRSSQLNRHRRVHSGGKLC